MIARLTTALTAALLGLACSSTGVGNPAPETLALAVVNDTGPDPEVPDAEEPIASDALRHAVIVFGELRWLACNGSEDDVVIPGPMMVDLATGQVEPRLPQLPVPDGGFCGLDAPLARAVSPATLTGRSVFFSGERADGTLFLLFADMSGTVRLRPRPDVAWDTQATPALIWAFRPGRWLAQSELDGAAPTALASRRRVIVIDVDRHPLLYAAIRGRIGRLSSLYADVNHNARLDRGERDPDHWLGEGLSDLD